MTLLIFVTETQSVPVPPNSRRLTTGGKYMAHVNASTIRTTLMEHKVKSCTVWVSPLSVPRLMADALTSRGDMATYIRPKLQCFRPAGDDAECEEGLYYSDADFTAFTARVECFYNSILLPKLTRMENSERSRALVLFGSDTFFMELLHVAGAAGVTRALAYKNFHVLVTRWSTQEGLQWVNCDEGYSG